jgi:hypothetical protein
VSGGDAPFLAPSGSLSIADGEGWGEAHAGTLYKELEICCSCEDSTRVLFSHF